MIVAVLDEGPKETRVAITPNSVKHYIQLGFDVLCETNAGSASGFTDVAYQNAGAQITTQRQALLAQTNILLTINEPLPKDLSELPNNALIITHVDNDPNGTLIQWCCKQQLSLFSMNSIPRISRAQGLDSLSSQANLAGYRAVLEGIHHFNRVVPMMMTAAGMIQPAKILILGAGVAGLQAIATAKRLGAIVYAFDVRRAAKEQIESLGAEFIEVNHDQTAENNTGYANEMSDEYKVAQAALIDHYAKMADIIVSTALIPGRPAPVLLKRESVEQMKPGSVIVDLATSRGGNCELSQRDKTIIHGGITLIGNSNFASLVPATASELYANNALNLLRLLATTPGTLTFNPDDEIIQQALLCHQGQYLPFSITHKV